MKPVWIDVEVAYQRMGSADSKVVSGRMVLGLTSDNKKVFTQDELACFQFELVLTEDCKGMALWRTEPPIKGLGKVKDRHYDLAGFLNIPNSALFSYSYDITIFNGEIGAFAG